MPNPFQSIHACWESWEERTVEQLTFTPSQDEISIHGVVSRLPRESNSPENVIVDYHIRCDISWCVRSFQMECSETQRTLTFQSDGNGNWSDANGPRIDFAGAIDIDITATPLTNSLPIRRLNLAIGESQLTKVLYIETPELKLSPEEQRYTRIGVNRYRFEQIATGFSRELEVDKDGLVLDYPGLFRRVQ